MGTFISLASGRRFSLFGRLRASPLPCLPLRSFPSSSDEDDDELEGSDGGPLPLTCDLSTDSLSGLEELLSGVDAWWLLADSKP